MTTEWVYSQIKEFCTKMQDEISKTVLTSDVTSEEDMFKNVKLTEQYRLLEILPEELINHLESKIRRE